MGTFQICTFFKHRRKKKMQLHNRPFVHLHSAVSFYYKITVFQTEERHKHKKQTQNWVNISKGNLFSWHQPRDGILVESLKALVSGRVILPCVSMAPSCCPHLYRLIIHPDTKMLFNLQRRIVHWGEIKKWRIKNAASVCLLNQTWHHNWGIFAASRQDRTGSQLERKRWRRRYPGR